MAARPRIKKNRGLPVNLYSEVKKGVTYFKYRRPDNGKSYSMGTDKVAAVQAAKQLNAELMQGYDLVSNVLGTNNSDTLESFITYFKENHFLKRKPAQASVKIFDIRVKQINKALGSKRVDEITIRDVATFLNTLTIRASNQARGYMVDIFNYAVAEGLCADNPAASTIKKIEEKQRKRHTIEGLKLIREASPQWLKNAIDLALITAQRREEIVSIKFDDIKDGYLYVVQQKTSKHSDAGWIRFKITSQLEQVIKNCRDNIPSPFLIHHKPTRRKQAENREHWTQILVDYLTRAFKKATEESGAYRELTEAEKPTFHEIRALSIKMYKQQGKDAQKIAGHASEQMTKNYAKGHDEIIWSEAIPDLDVSNLL